MSTLAETISSALRAVGPATEDRLRDIVADFDSLNLTDEERLAAIATTVAATARTHHGRHPAVYLDAVRTWSLEIAQELKSAPLRFRFPADVERIAEAADILTNGVDSLIELMAALGARTQDRLVTELALVAQLLGQADAGTIQVTLGAIDRALASKSFQSGAIVMVPLRRGAGLIDRSANLELLQPRGSA